MSELDSIVSALLGADVTVQSSAQASGGCIHDSRSLTLADGRRVFLKANTAGSAPVFRAEAEGLKALAATRTVRVPAVLGQGVFGDRAFLLLEHLDLRSLRDGSRLGEELAALHRHTAPTFGFSADNFLGASPQPNPRAEDWVEFLRRARFEPQFRWAKKRGYDFSDVAHFLDVLPAFFEDYQPAPSLLHGDLWAGNAAALDDGTPVVFDPAVHYGDRECDLAMTELFGGFGPSFYEAYEAAWPLDPGYRTIRREFYQLYHLLNHTNLFGGGYASSAARGLRHLLDYATSR